MRPHLLAAVLALSVVSSAAHAQPQTRRVYSAPWAPSESTVREADRAVARREILPAARRLWSRAPGCSETFRVIGAADGAFTGRGLAQRAVLYRFCEAGRDQARGGVAIVEAGRMVAHVTIEHATPDALQTGPDVDENGVGELVLVDSLRENGVITADVALVQLEPGGVRSFGAITVYDENFGTDQPMHREMASILTATPGPTPVFELETYIFREGMRARWVGLDRPHRVTLAQGRATYRRVR